MSRALLFVRGFSLFQTFLISPSSTFIRRRRRRKERNHTFIFRTHTATRNHKKKYYPFTYYIISLFPKTNQHTTYNQPTNQPCIFCNNTLVSHSLLIVFLFIILFNSSSRESPSSSYVFFFPNFFLHMYVYIPRYVFFVFIPLFCIVVE